MRVPDPYRWLEDLERPETEAWVRAQDVFTEQLLAAIPGREQLGARLAKLHAFERWTVPVRAGSRTFALWHDGTWSQPGLCVLGDPGERPTVLVDPNAWSPDGTVAITAFVPSPDGSRVAYSVARAGSDWTQWQVVEVASGAILDDHLERVRFSSPAWARDGSRLFYSAFGPDDISRVFRHTLGSAATELIFFREDHPQWRYQPVVTEDGRWLVLYAFDQTGGPNGIACVDLRTNASTILPDAFAARFAFCGNDSSIFWLWTDLDAPRGRLVQIDIMNLGTGWQEVVPETLDTLQWAVPKGDRFLAGYLADGRSIVRRYTFEGAPDGDVALPGVGWAGGFGGARSDPATPFVFMSFTRPPSPFVYDSGTDTVTSLAAAGPELDLETTQHFYESRDGTRIPMFVTCARDFQGPRPALLCGYGGFGIPMVPFYWPLAIAWMERGGIFAVPGIRGGGEYGVAWHTGGSGPNKQNSFNDFIAAAQWLIAGGYTRRENLAISGASNGGLLVGACITQRPDLFAAAHIDMGLLDMLNIDRVRVGLHMSEEYGSLQNESDFKRLLGYSPLHNIRAGTRYPATILTTGNHDELVVPSNSYKFAATLQAAQAADLPIALRVEADAGHGVGKSTAKTLAEQSDVLAFLWRYAGAE